MEKKTYRGNDLLKVRAVPIEEVKEIDRLTKEVQEAYLDFIVRSNNCKIKPFILAYEVDNWEEWEKVFGPGSPAKFRFANGVELYIIKK